MEGLAFLWSGFAAALTPANLLFALAGCVLGTLIGVLPGLGPAAGTAILIPLTFALDATGAIIMLAAIYYGAMYGGTITSVLINVPGEAASVVTCLDGYQMARQGRAGTALGIAAIGSFIGGVVASVALAVVAPPLARFALSFGPPEFFSLMVLGLCLVTGLAGQSLVAALLMTVLELRHAEREARRAGALRRPRLRAGGDGAVRRGRDPAHGRGALPPAGRDQDQGPVAGPRRMAALERGDRPGHRGRARARAHSGSGRRDP